MIYVGHTDHSSNYWLLDPNKHYEKQKGRDVCFLEDAVPRVCTDDILMLEGETLESGGDVDVQITTPLNFQ